MSAAKPTAPVETAPAATVSPKPTRKPGKRLYAVKDRRGIVVATSTTPTPQETVETHAAALLDWLQRQNEFAGQTVLYGVLGQLYVETFCPAHGCTPFPWRAVGDALGDQPGVTRDKLHIYTDDGRRRVKRLVLRLPEASADVVDIPARRCA